MGTLTSPIGPGWEERISVICPSADLTGVELCDLLNKNRADIARKVENKEYAKPNWPLYCGRVFFSGGCGNFLTACCVSMEDWFYRGVAYGLFYDMKFKTGSCCTQWTEEHKEAAGYVLAKLDVRNAIMANYLAEAAI